MMELRHIDGQPVIITRQGKKELVTPASGVIAQAKQRIQDATAMLSSLETASIDAQASLEAALLRGDPTDDIRKEQSTVAELTADQHRELSDAKADIALVIRLIDQHAAEQIRLADQAAIAALTKPFTDFLEKHNVN